jgi:demethylmenaquinone methyltransferase/2-methoxy-6-polyprenyl-1,4-benzoquinol methylase
MTQPHDFVTATAEYYAARAPVYDETAGYTEPYAEMLREPIKARFKRLFAGHRVLEIACGTGYWSPTVAEVAEWVHAIDVNPAVLSQAKQRCKHLGNVTFQEADAYTLAGVPDGFSAAFGIWWWSHVPRERLREFLTTLHSKLEPGALVLFRDQLVYDAASRRKDAHGNTLEERSLPDGRTFEIVKNFPTEREVYSALAGLADKVEYVERPHEKNWSVTYNVKSG